MGILREKGFLSSRRAGRADVLNSLGRQLVERLGPLSIELAILTAVVIVVLALLRPKSAAIRHLFWCTVLIKPPVTILVASPVSLYGFRESRPAPVAIATCVASGADEIWSAGRVGRQAAAAGGLAGHAFDSEAGPG